MMSHTNALTRWRLILGGDEADGTGQSLDGALQGLDQTLSELYDADPSKRKGGLGASSPKVHRWLGDIRRYFPSSVVRVMQQDAMQRLGLKQLLLEPEVLQAIEPDVNLVATLLSLKDVMPEQSRATARQVVAALVEDLQRRLRMPLLQALRGALHRGTRNYRPRFKEIDWHRTIRLNLRHYQPTTRSIIPQRVVGFGRKGAALKDVILAVDQSGSMAPSVIYASVFGAVMASMSALRTQLVAFDTAVVDLTRDLSDPVDLLFGVQLGGGTDIHRALSYCRSLVQRPRDTVLVLISDLYEGGNRQGMLRTAAELKANGVTVIVLLALSDQGKPFYDEAMATQMASLDIPAFACTPDQFPGVMAAALAGEAMPR
jgi:Mg-chelatase subunit ChlD